MEALKRLCGMTFVLQHNPNCPSPFLVRLVGEGRGMIDLLSPERTKDRLYYGKTLEEAVNRAVS